METAAFDAVSQYGAEDCKPGAVKLELDKDSTSLGEVKREPPGQEEPAEEFTGRTTRKRQLNSMAETSDLSDESADENYSKTPAKKRSRGGGGGGAASAGRTRGRPKRAAEPPANQADPSRNPRIVLKNIASASQDEQDESSGNIKANSRSSRGKKERGGRTPAAKTPPKSASKSKPKAPKVPVDEDEDDDNDEDFAEDIDDDDDDDEDFVPKKGKKGRAAKQTFRSRSKGKSKSKPKQESENEEDEEDEEDEDEDEGEEDEAGADAAGDGANDNVDAVKTGQYLIEKSDMRHLENYPIWRMEGPNMLRKFEMIVQDGVVRHKSLYAYSSWAHTMLDLYEKIQVKHMSSQDGETIVEISQECLPKPPELSSLESKYSGDQLLPFYQVCVDAMFRQSVDSSFLKRIKMENDLHYLGAINHLDAIIRDKISNIESEVSMKDEFKSRVRNCPNMKSIRRQNWSQTDQATTNKSSEKGVRSVLMFGFGYDPFLMEEDKSKGVEVAQEVVVGSTMERYLAAYHGLIHYKLTLLKRCQDKVKLTNALEPGGDSNVLEKCLQDRCWILQTFDELKNLLANENLS